MTSKGVLFALLEALAYAAVDYFCHPIIHSVLSSEPSQDVPLGALLEIGVVGLKSQTATCLGMGETA